MLALGYIDGAIVRNVSAYYADSRNVNNYGNKSSTVKKNTYRKVANIYYGNHQAKGKAIPLHIGMAEDSPENLSALGKALTLMCDTIANFKENVDVKHFVELYNETHESASMLSSKSIKAEVAKFFVISNLFQNRLEQIGITMDTKGNLLFQNQLFTETEENLAEKLFHNHLDYGYQINSQALIIGHMLRRELLKANTYNLSGAYSNNYSYAINNYV